MRQHQIGQYYSSFETENIESVNQNRKQYFHRQTQLDTIKSDLRFSVLLLQCPVNNRGTSHRR